MAYPCSLRDFLLSEKTVRPPVPLEPVDAGTCIDVIIDVNGSLRAKPRCLARTAQEGLYAIGYPISVRRVCRPALRDYRIGATAGSFVHRRRSSVPNQRRVSSSGRHGAAAVESVTFSIYAEATGGTPLWQETQKLAIDSQGRYSAFLGATTDGLPVDLFAKGEPRWLGLHFLRAGEAELPRTLATSVPYAMKAAKASDADTLGGLPASAFVRSDGTGGSGGSAGGPGVVIPIGDPVAVTSGTSGRIGKFVNATDLGDSVMTESSGRIGVGTTAPLDFMHTQFTSDDRRRHGLCRAEPGQLGHFLFRHAVLRPHQRAEAIPGVQQLHAGYRINNIAPSGSINFMIGSTSRFLVDNSGNIGIGQPTPAYKLDILHPGFNGIRVKSTANFSVLDIDASDGDSALRFASNGVNQWNIRNRPGDNFFEIFEMGGGGSRVVIEDGTGRVIINAGTGAERLTVARRHPGGHRHERLRPRRGRHGHHRCLLVGPPVQERRDAVFTDPGALCPAAARQLLLARVRVRGQAVRDEAVVRSHRPGGAGSVSRPRDDRRPGLPCRELQQAAAADDAGREGAQGRERRPQGAERRAGSSYVGAGSGDQGTAEAVDRADVLAAFGGCENRCGGEEGIRTPGSLSTSTVFKTAALNHSATSPFGCRARARPATCTYCSPTDSVERSFTLS